MASMEFKNNARSTVADDPLAQAATTLNVATGEGANFPDAFPFLITIWDAITHSNPGDDPDMEIDECTGRTDDALTIVRGQEGTGDVEHALGERVAMLVTAGHFTDIVTKLDTIEDSAKDDQTASEVPIVDSGSIIDATEVENALQENRTAIDLNTAKDTNVSTDLSEGTATETTVDVNSSDGTNATLISASISRAGLLTKAKFDEIVANTSKVTNAAHTGDVTGSEELTIGAKKVKDTHVDWGTGAGQVSSCDVPDHDTHTIRDTFVHIVNRGVAEAITITLTGGLNFSWTSGEIYDVANCAFVHTEAGSGSVTNHAVNYLKWVSGTTLTISTSDATGDEVLIAIGSVYDGNINGYREMSLLDESLANIRRCARAVFPTRVISGMSVHEDIDAANPLDVTMDAGLFCKELQQGVTPVEIKSRNTAMVRHFHTAGVWDSDTNAQIETTNYDNGTQKTAIPSNKWVKGLFIYMNGKIGFVYPAEYFTNKAEAEEAALPTMPTGLGPVPKLTAIVYQQGTSTFATAVWQDVRAGISEQAFGGVSDHGALAGLSDDDHPQYIKDSEFTADSEILVGTGAGTFQKESGATLRTSIGVAIGTDVLAEQTIGIADDNLVEIDGADIANGEYAKFTVNGLQSKSVAEVLSDLSVESGADVTADNPPQTHTMSTHTDEGALATLNSVDTGQIDDDAVTYAKMQNVVSDERILGRVSGADGIVEELTAAQVLTLIAVEANADVTDPTNIASSIVNVAAKSTPVNADTIPIIDSEDASSLKELTWQQMKATLKTYNDTLYNLYVHPNHSGDVTSVADGAQTVDKTAISGKGLVTAVGSDHVLIGDASDSDNLKKALVSDLTGTGTTITAESFSVDVAHLTTDQDAGKAFTISSFPEHAQIKKISVRADFTAGQQSNTGSALINDGTGVAPADTEIVYDGDSPTDLFAVNDIIIIDAERMKVTGVDTGTNTLTVTRGIKGTMAAYHDDNAVIIKGNHGIRLVLFKNSDKKYSEMVIDLPLLMTYKGVTDDAISVNDDYFGLTADMQNLGNNDFLVIEDTVEEVCRVQNVNHNIENATFDYTIFVQDDLAAHDTTKTVKKLIIFDLDVPCSLDTGTLHGTVYVGEKIIATVNVKVEIETDSYT